MAERVSRRRFLGVAGKSAVGLYVAGLAGCGGSTGGQGTGEQGGGGGGAGGGGGGTTTLRVSWWGSDERHQRYLEAIELFEQRHPDVDLSPEYADLTPYLERLATQTAANNTPDVMWMRDAVLTTYARSGAFLPLDDFLGTTIDVSGMDDAAIADGTVDGAVYALPTHYVGQAVFADAEVLESVGIAEPDDASWTWEDVASIAQQISDAKGEGFWGSNDATLSGTQRHFEAWVRQSGGELFDAQGQLGFTREVAAEWFRYWDAQRQSGAVVPPSVQLESEGHEGSPLIREVAGLHWASTNHYAILQGLTPKTINMYLMPALPDASPDWHFFPPILITISANTSAPELSAELVNFFINDPEAAAITQVSHGAPSSSGVREALGPQLPPAETAFIEQISQEMELERRPYPAPPPGGGEVKELITRVSEQIAFGQLSPEEGADSVLQEGARILETAASAVTG